MLSEVAALYAEVLEKGIKGGWVDAGDEAASSRLLGWRWSRPSPSPTPGVGSRPLCMHPESGRKGPD